LRIGKLVCLGVAASAAAAAAAHGGGAAGDTPTTFVIQSHRGAGVLSAENTLEAFELGWSLGTYPEADVRATSDGVIVAFHDADFKRVVRDPSPELAQKGVEQITWEELKRLDVGETKDGKWVSRSVPRLVDVFRIMAGKPDRHLYLDIKKVNLEQLAREVKEHGVEKQVVLAAPEHATLRRWRELVPGSDTLLWVGGKPEQQAAKFEAARAANFADITQLQMHVHLKGKAEEVKRDSAHPFVQPDAFLRDVGHTLREHGILYQSLPYGGSTRDIYWKLADLGVQSFATDYPDVLIEAMRVYSSGQGQR
jgi:glycerophosphoryl diester phosphodiesterase